MDHLAMTVQLVYEAVQDTPGAAAVVIVDHPNPDIGRGGFVVVPKGQGMDITVLGLLGGSALKGEREKNTALFDAAAMVLLDMDVAEG